MEVEQEALGKSFSYLATTLNLKDPTLEFKLVHSIKDDLGMHHFRLQQIHQGLPVFGQQIIVHLTKDMQVRDFTGEYRKDVSSINTDFKISPSEAIKIADKHSGNLSPNGKVEVELVIYPNPKTDKSVLVQLVTLPVWQEDIPKRLCYFIDANSGEILHSYNAQPITRK